VFKRYFITGLLVWVPLVSTVWVLTLLVNTLESLVPEFLSSLAISGVDGTVRRRLRGDTVRGMAHLKTGSLRDARAVAGYVLGASGKRTIVVSLVNHAQAANAQPFHDALIRWLAAR